MDPPIGGIMATSQIKLTTKETVQKALQDLDIDCIRDSLLRFASDDSEEAIRSLALLTVCDKLPGSNSVTGLGIRRTDVLLSDIAHEIENLELPFFVKKHYDLTKQQWSAATRLITLILLALEK